MKKFLKTALALVLALAMIVPASLTSVKAANPSDDITILFTNDVHTYINKAISYDNIAELKDSYEEAGKAVILVDAGDHIQGTAYGGLDEGKSVVKLMEAAGYDIATPGNHEFDYGMARALEVVTNENIPYVSCNFIDLKTNKPVLDAYKIFEKNGVKIAFVGITTPETYTKSTPKYFMDENDEFIYNLCEDATGEKLYAAVQSAIDAAKADGADIVIGLGHLGVDPTSTPWTSKEVIANTTGMSAFIDGHSHSVVDNEIVKNKNGADVVLSQTGSYFDRIGKMTVSKSGKISTEFITEYAESDAEVKALVDEWKNSVDEQLGEVIAYTDVDLKMYTDKGTRLVRKQETNLGDFCADAIYYLFNETEGLKIDVAIMNGGGIRAQVNAGEISYNTCKTVHTFGNVICLMSITGQQLLDALEWGAKSVMEGENGGFLHCAGIKVTVDPSIPANVIKNDAGLWAGSNPDAPYRVTSVKILNNETGKYEALDLTKEYNIGGTNYTLRQLGDGFAMFKGATLVKDYVMMDYLCLANYAKSFKKGATGLPTITAEDYGTRNGWLTIKRIKPVAVTVDSAVSTKAGKLTVSYQQVKSAGGYQVVIADNAEFTGKKSYYTRKLTKTVKNLAAGTYYVKVRGYYTNQDGYRVYGAYSEVQEIVVK